VLPGSTIVVFATEGNEAKVGTPITVTDTANNAYSLIDQVDDLTTAAWQSLFSFAAYNVAGGSVTLHVSYTATDQLWHGVLIVEMAGVSAAPLVGHAKNNQAITAKTLTDSITSGAVAAGTQPATVLALSQATLDYIGGPNAGTGYAANTAIWNWGINPATAEGALNAPSALLEFEHLTSPGSVAATFTPVGTAGGGDRYNTLAVVLTDGP
jgi:hypothetical protein